MTVDDPVGGKWGSEPLPGPLKKLLLVPNRHKCPNKINNQLKAVILQNWDDKLYEYALNWSKQCTFDHSNGPYGENLWTSTDDTIPDGEFLFEEFDFFRRFP